MKILIINGPNLNMLGKREPDIYGQLSLESINEIIKNEAEKDGIETSFFQSNIEGEIVSCIQAADDKYDGIIINPGAYSHYSIAILDALRSIKIDSVEVHLSNISSREDFRKESVTSQGSVGVIAGFGELSYTMALKYFKDRKNKG